MEFDLIKNIIPSDRNSWWGKNYVTVDIDWAADFVLDYAIDQFEKINIPVTWFVTHDTPILNRIRKNNKFELGIHPNFNPLLNCSSKSEKDMFGILSDIMKVVPGACSVRSHSMLQSTPILKMFKDFGITHDVNQFVPANSGNALCPWVSWDGLYRIPYLWEDDIYCLFKQFGRREKKPSEILSENIPIKVFDFHPIHLYLNTEDMNRYMSAKDCTYDKIKLDKFICDDFGTLDLLYEMFDLKR